MTRRLTLVFGCVVIAAALISGPASSRDEDLTEGISLLRYTPRPVYSDLSRIRVRFATTSRAGPGRQYVVQLLIFGSAGPTSDPDCTIAAFYPAVGSSTHILGGPGREYTVPLPAYDPIFGTRHFCKGQAIISVCTRSIRKPPSLTTRCYRRVILRILPAT
jgi:hypothetical protein